MKAEDKNLLKGQPATLAANKLLEPEEARRRKRERVTVLILGVTILILTAVEVHLLRVSSQLPFVNSIFFFGLMNVNLILVMIMLFLVFRNAVKLVLDERHGRLGSRLKTRLVFSFVLFAVIPTVILFSVSAFYIKNSFDKWFSLKVGGTLQKSINVVRNYYEAAEVNTQHFARRAGFKLFPHVPNKSKSALTEILKKIRLEYGLDALEYYPDPFSSRILIQSSLHKNAPPPVTIETLKRVFSGAQECRVLNLGDGELIRCSTPLGANRGVLFADTFIPLNLATQLGEIQGTYSDYRSDNPLNYPIKSTYFAILSMVTLLILFAATWTGFYVARRLTVPIEELAKGTEQVAHGNLNYVIPTSGSDEMYKLIESFNQMIRDLKLGREEIETTHSDLHRTNEELNHRSRYIEVLLKSVQSGVISFDQMGRISVVNPAAVRLLEISTDLKGRPYWAIIPKEQRADIRALLTGLSDYPHPIRREMRIQRSKGEVANVLCTLSVLRDESQKQLGVVAVFEDVTDLQKVERMYAWREVAKRIAHEIKNPLTPIQLSVERLRRRYLDKIKDDGTFGSATQLILKEVESLRTMVNEFSSFARLPEISPRPEDLNSIVLDSVNLFRAAHEGILFDLNLASDLPMLELDRSSIKRVLINLFDNSVTAMQGRGRIQVWTKLESSSKSIQLGVSDEGCGIPPNAVPQLFEPYFSTKAGGTGLGLAIVQRILSDHTATVRVAPNIPKGTQFIIEFPVTLSIQETKRREVGALPV